MRTSASPGALAPKGRGVAAKCGGALARLGLLLGVGCSGGAPLPAGSPPPPPTVDAPLVDLQPGAWFDAGGSLMVVGPGRRLRLILSAPVSACSSALLGEGTAEEVSSRASLPFHVLAEACRDAHPTILLAEEGETASPTELERSYHEVARCAEADLALSDGWRPDILQGPDPCPSALGLGWRLPTVKELSGLSLDDRKAIAGALFDPEVPGAFGSLLVYARDPQAELLLATLSPNASDRAPQLGSRRLDQPLFGVSLRCVRDSLGKAPPVPVLPHATDCLREHRRTRELLTRSGAPAPAELKQLKAWLDRAELQPRSVQNPRSLAELEQLLTSPTLERLARDARDEQALTERYAELADAVDDPSVSPAERRRRRDEFAHLRRRLGGQLVQAAQEASPGRAQLGAVLTRLQAVLEEAAATSERAKTGTKPSYDPVLSRLRALGAKSAP